MWLALSVARAGTTACRRPASVVSQRFADNPRKAGEDLICGLVHTNGFGDSLVTLRSTTPGVAATYELSEAYVHEASFSILEHELPPQC